MDKTLELLQFIARTAYKTQETVKTMSIYFKDADNSIIQHLYILIEGVKIISLKSALELTGHSGNEDLNAILNDINNRLESIREIYTTLKKTIPSSVPENQKYRLEANIQGLENYSTELKILA